MKVKNRLWLSLTFIVLLLHKIQKREYWGDKMNADKMTLRVQQSLNDAYEIAVK